MTRDLSNSVKIATLLGLNQGNPFSGNNGVMARAQEAEGGEERICDALHQ